MDNLAALAAAGAGPGAVNTRTPLQKQKNKVNALKARFNARAAELKPHKLSWARNNTARALHNNLKTARNKLAKLTKNETRRTLQAKVPDYVVVKGNKLEEFQISVMEKLSQGYILQGGVSVSTYATQGNGIVPYYSQALIKSVPPPVNLLSNNVELLRL